MFKRLSTLIVCTAALAIGATVACGPAAPPTPTAAARAGTTGAATVSPAGTASPAASAAMTGTPAAARTGTPMAGTTGTTGTPSAGTAGAMATGTPSTGTTGTTGTPSAATTGTPQIRIVQSLDLNNPTPITIDLSGWKLRIGGQTITLPQNARLGPNETVTIHFVSPPATPSAGATSAPTASGNDIYLGEQGLQLMGALRPGARLALETPQGQTVTEFALPA